MSLRQFTGIFILSMKHELHPVYDIFYGEHPYNYSRNIISLVANATCCGELCIFHSSHLPLWRLDIQYMSDLFVIVNN